MDRTDKLSELLYELICQQANIKTELTYYQRTAHAASMRIHSLHRKLTHIAAQVKSVENEIERVQQK